MHSLFLLLQHIMDNEFFLGIPFGAVEHVQATHNATLQQYGHHTCSDQLCLYHQRQSSMY